MPGRVKRLGICSKHRLSASQWLSSAKQCAFHSSFKFFQPFFPKRLCCRVGYS